MSAFDPKRTSPEHWANFPACIVLLICAFRASLLSERSLNCAAHQVSRYANCEHDCKQSHKEAVGKPRRRISSWTCRIRTQHLLTLFNLKDSDHLARVRFFRTTRFKQDAVITLILRWHEASRYEEWGSVRALISNRVNWYRSWSLSMSQALAPHTEMQLLTGRTEARFGGVLRCKCLLLTPSGHWLPSSTIAIFVTAITRKVWAFSHSNRGVVRDITHDNFQILGDSHVRDIRKLDKPGSYRGARCWTTPLSKLGGADNMRWLPRALH